MIRTPWPGLVVYARLAGMLEPYVPENAHRFRGEEAFAPDTVGWRRWRQPSPEPELGMAFAEEVLAAVGREAAAVNALVTRLAERIASDSAAPPVLIAVLRAGVPIGALLARRLGERLGESVPFAALSLFEGLGWDAEALAAVLAAHPGRAIWFVDGWTSGGAVARELRASHARWLAAGLPDFTEGLGPRLAVLCDPGGFADASATHVDRFIPSACFTAPETLGFSRGFAPGPTGMFEVYAFPEALVRPSLVAAWLAVGDASTCPVAVGEPTEVAPPPGWRLHVNEVVRALINRRPREVWVALPEDRALETLAPLVHLCRLRHVPVRYGRLEVAAWGTLAAARMSS